MTDGPYRDLVWDEVAVPGESLGTVVVPDHSRVEATEANLVIRALRTAEQIDEAAAALWTAWGARSSAARSEVIGASVLRALVWSGNYVFGAYQGRELVGCSVGWLGVDPGLPDELQRADHLHSHISGVKPSRQNRGVGFALKRHQRAWALERGITAIQWTFDPLVRRNAYFNLCKLAATVVGYHPDFYGDLDDGINTGKATDRLLIEWSLTSQPVVEAMTGIACLAAERERSRPDAKLIKVPSDIDVVRRADPERSCALRESVRTEFQRLLGRGYRVVGITRDGHYVLRPGATAKRRGR